MIIANENLAQVQSRYLKNIPNTNYSDKDIIQMRDQLINSQDPQENRDEERNKNLLPLPVDEEKVMSGESIKKKVAELFGSEEKNFTEAMEKEAEAMRDQSTKEVPELKHIMNWSLKRFIKSQFPQKMLKRLKTFEKFSFWREHYEKKTLELFLSEIRSFKQPKGTLKVNDLWTENMRKEMLERCSFTAEKTKLEMYHLAKDRINAQRKKHEIESFILDKRRENILKGLLHAKRHKEETEADKEKKEMNRIRESWNKETPKKQPELITKKGCYNPKRSHAYMTEGTHSTTQKQ
jgi:hypothetical protein